MIRNLITLTTFAACAAMSMNAGATDDTESTKRVNYVKSVTETGYWTCIATPRTSNIQPMTYTLAINIEPVIGASAVMKSWTKLDDGKAYTSRVEMYGPVTRYHDGLAVIEFTRFENFRGDPLPSYAEWGDPDGDLINLSIVPDTRSKVRKPYMLVGYRKTEFGAEDLDCVAAGGAPSVQDGRSLSDVASKDSHDLSALIETVLRQDSKIYSWVCEHSPGPLQTNSQGEKIIKPVVQILNFKRLQSGDIEATFIGKVDGRNVAYRSNRSKIVEPIQAGDTHIVLKKAWNIIRDPLPSGYTWADPKEDEFRLKFVKDELPDAAFPYMLSGTLTDEAGSNPFTCAVQKF